MALVGFYHAFSLFTSPVTSIHAGARDDRRCARKRVHMVKVPERKGALNSLVVSGFKPLQPAWQASSLSIVLCPSGKLVRHRTAHKRPQSFIHSKYCLSSFQITTVTPYATSNKDLPNVNEIVFENNLDQFLEQSSANQLKGSPDVWKVVETFGTLFEVSAAAAEPSERSQLPLCRKHWENCLRYFLRKFRRILVHGHVKEQVMYFSNLKAA